ncbi:MAG TPA: hypothetical protein VD713_06695, partial [Sphingomonadales bacterium]|nr:hypothetical protein [Sphingomonadales bacterium]
MAAFETLTVEITADTSALKRALAEVEAEVAGLDETFRTLPRGVSLPPNPCFPPDPETDDETEEAVEEFNAVAAQAIHELSASLAAAFADMAVTGEFSAKKIGQAFLAVLLDIVQRELIQKPLEELFKNLFQIIIPGSASGNA